MSIQLEWKGEKFVIADNEAFEVGEVIEEIVTLSELAEMSSKPKFRKLAKCFAAMINFAGGKVSPDTIHKEMMSEIKKGGDETKNLIAISAINALIEILMDGAPVGEGDADEGKPVGGSLKAVSA